MSNVLFLLDYFRENQSANGICCKKVIDEMSSTGDNVIVASYRDKKAPPVEFKDNILIYNIHTIEKKKKTIADGVIFYLKWLNPFYRYPVTEDKKITEEIIDVAKIIIAKHKIEKIVCVHLPIETLCAGIELKKEYPHIKFYSYMLDSLSGGLRPRFLPKKFTLSRKIQWEDNVLHHYDKIILMESSKEHHKAFTNNKKWMKRAIYADIPMFTPKGKNSKAFEKRETDSIGIIFTGTMGEGIRTPYSFLKLLNQIDINKEIICTFVGSNYCKKDLKSFIDNPRITIKETGLVSHEESTKMIEEYDILLNLGNVNQALVPSKVFEYMSYGKPIITTYISEKDTSLTYLERYPMALMIDENDINSGKQNLVEFISKFRNSYILSDEWKEDFKKNTPKYTAEILLKG